jgi:hypothetical protein
MDRKDTFDYHEGLFSHRISGQNIHEVVLMPLPPQNLAWISRWYYNRQIGYKYSFIAGN